MSDFLIFVIHFRLRYDLSTLIFALFRLVLPDVKISKENTRRATRVSQQTARRGAPARWLLRTPLLRVYLELTGIDGHRSLTVLGILVQDAAHPGLVLAGIAHPSCFRFCMFFFIAG